jgi:hypothetical protein
MHTATTLEIVCTLLKAGMGIAIIPTVRWHTAATN